MKKQNDFLNHLNFPIQHTVTTTPEALKKLTTTLDDFEAITPELAVLNCSGGKLYSIVTDGQYAVLLNAEGFNYPRYRGPRIAIHLLATLDANDVNRLCVRKQCWNNTFAIETPEQLKTVIAAPYEYVA